MLKVRKLFTKREEQCAYDSFILIWPLANPLTSHLVRLLPPETTNTNLSESIIVGINEYHALRELALTDWERLAVYFIHMANFVRCELRGTITFWDIAKSCPLPRKLSISFIEETAKKLSMRLADA